MGECCLRIVKRLLNHYQVRLFYNAVDNKCPAYKIICNNSQDMKKF